MRIKFWKAEAPSVRGASGPEHSDNQLAMPVTPPVLGDLDLRQVWTALLRRKAWIIIPTAVAAALSFAAVNTITPRYRSEARILVDGRENVFLRPNAERIEERTALDAEAIASQVQVVLSRDLAREIIRRNKLGERPEFDPVLQGLSPIGALLGLIGIGRDPLKLSAEERVLNAYYDRLTAYAADKSRVIVIEFQSRDPELAARVANSIAEGYMSMQQGAKQDQARSAGQWLAGEIDGLRKKVAEAEARVEDFRGKASLFVGTNNTTLSNQQMGEINTQLSNARAQKSDAESKARSIRNMLQTGRPIEASEVLNSELVRRLGEQRVTLRAQLAEQSSTLLDGHPRIKELRAQITDLDRQIREEASKISRSLENDARIAGARAESMSASLEQLKKQAVSTNGQDVQMRALEREAKAQRDLLESYLAKFREATTRESIELGSDSRVISRAIVTNTPAFPKKLPIVLIATLATFMLAVGTIVTGELLRMTAPRPVAAIVQPRLPVKAEPRAEMRSPMSELEEVVSDLQKAGEAARKITVLGVSEAGGTSLTALALARRMSREGSVVLVDASLKSGVLKTVVADPTAPGLSELVLGAASFGQIISKDRSSGAQIVTAGNATIDASMMHSPRLAMTIDALMRVYDRVILDVGSLDEVPEQLAASNAYAVLVSAGELDGRTRNVIRDELKTAGFRGVTMMDGAVDQSSLDRPGQHMAAA